MMGLHKSQETGDKQPNKNTVSERSAGEKILNNM
jgi:hypothetical protein